MDPNTRSDEIKKIFINHFPEEIVKNILEKEKNIQIEEAKRYHLSVSPIYSGYPDNYFFTLKKHRHILYDKDFQLMNHIRVIDGSLEIVRKHIGERIWGKYLSSFRY